MSYCQLWDALIPLWRRRRSKGRIHSAEFVCAHFLVAVLVLSVKHEATAELQSPTFSRRAHLQKSIERDRTKMADFTESTHVKGLIK